MFDKLCTKSWVMAGVVAVAATLLVGNVYAARSRTVSKAVSVQKGNKTVTKTVTKTKGRGAAQANAAVATASASAGGVATASASSGSRASASVVGTQKSFAAVSHNGFAVGNFHNHNFHNRAFAVNHGYHNNFAFANHGYGYGYNQVQVVQPVTFAIATPLTVATAELPVEIVNAPAVPVTETKVTTVQTTPAYGTTAPATYSYATQKVIGVQKVTTVAVPLQIVGVKTVTGY